MLKLKKILFPTDFTRCSDQAFNHALFMAEQFGATLQLFHAIVLHEDDPADPARRFPEGEELFRRLFEIADSELAARLEQHGEGPVTIEEYRGRGVSAAETILDHAAEHDVDLIVMGTHGRRGPARLFYGSVAEEVVRFARVPVLTLRELEEPREIEAFERILVPIDFSGHSKEAIAYARELAGAYDARLQLLHVIEEPSYPYFYAPLDGVRPAEHLAALRTKTIDALHELMDESPEGSYDVEVTSGHPASEIVAFAEERQSDMIVTATHGLTGLERLLVGSTAEQVLRTSPAPVFLVKSFGKRVLRAGSE